MRKIYFLLVATLLMGQNVKAELLIEPYIGTHINSEFDFGSVTEGVSGMALGGRLGYQTFGVQIGLNYKTGVLDVEDNSDADYSHTGVFIGYEFPVLIRVWGEYLLSSSLEFDSGDEYDDGTGTTIGIGYTGLPFLAINFETTKVSYGELNGSSGDADLSTYMISVSVPFTL